MPLKKKLYSIYSIIILHKTDFVHWARAFWCLGYKWVNLDVVHELHVDTLSVVFTWRKNRCSNQEPFIFSPGAPNDKRQELFLKAVVRKKTLTSDKLGSGS